MSSSPSAAALLCCPSPRSKLLSIKMRFFLLNKHRCSSLSWLSLCLIGVVIGFSVTMCLQSMSGVPPTSVLLHPSLHSAQHHSSSKCYKGGDGKKDGFPGNLEQGDGRQDMGTEDSGMGLDRSSDQSYIDRLLDTGKHGERGLILIGIMTAQKYVDTRAWNLWRTWAPYINGRVVFFVAEGTTTRHNDQMPIIRLPGTDDSYPPQKKSFMMLKWMGDHGLDRFEWFMRADDDVYVRADKLEIFLRSLNSSQPYFMGQAGLGTAEEYGTLNLGSEDNYCMGGPGIIMSKRTLSGILDHIPYCLRNMYTTHEDVEVGRCVRKFAGVTCSWSYQMQSVFYNNQSGMAAYSGDLNVGEVEAAITLHPVKRTSVMRRLHAFLRRVKTDHLTFRSLQLRRDILTVVSQLTRLGQEVGSKTYYPYIEAGRKPSLINEDGGTAPLPSETQIWDFLSPNILFCTDAINCPRHNAQTYLKYSLNTVIRQLMEMMNKYGRQRGRLLEFQETLYGYRRVNPLHGAHYILDLLLLYKKFKGRRVTVPVRRHAYLQQTFGDVEVTSDMHFRRYLYPTGHPSPQDEELSSSSSSYTQSLPQAPPPLLQQTSGRRSHFLEPPLKDTNQWPPEKGGEGGLPAGPGPARVNGPSSFDFFQSSSSSLSKRWNVDRRKMDGRGWPYGKEAATNNDIDNANNYEDRLSSDNQTSLFHYSSNNDNRNPDSTDNIPIHFILPLSGRSQAFQRFLAHFEALCLHPETMVDPNVYLLVVLFVGSPSGSLSQAALTEDQATLDALRDLRDRYPAGERVRWLEIRDRPFSRGLALSRGAAALDTEALMFFTDADVVFSQAALGRIRRNTIPGRQLYFPIVFSEFTPATWSHHDNQPITGSDESKWTLSNERGYFRYFGFGIVALYRSDLDVVGGMETGIHGWGLEDVNLFEKVLKGEGSGNLTIFRSPDPGIVHIYHPVICSRDLPSGQYEMCLGSRVANYASVSSLARMLPDDFDGDVPGLLQRPRSSAFSDDSGTAAEGGTAADDGAEPSDNIVVTKMGVVDGDEGDQNDGEGDLQSLPQYSYQDHIHRIQRRRTHRRHSVRNGDRDGPPDRIKTDYGNQDQSENGALLRLSQSSSSSFPLRAESNPPMFESSETGKYKSALNSNNNNNHKRTWLVQQQSTAADRDPHSVGQKDLTFLHPHDDETTSFTTSSQHANLQHMTHRRRGLG